MPSSGKTAPSTACVITVVCCQSRWLVGLRPRWPIQCWLGRCAACSALHVRAVVPHQFRGAAAAGTAKAACLAWSSSWGPVDDVSSAGSSLSVTRVAGLNGQACAWAFTSAVRGQTVPAGLSWGQDNIANVLIMPRLALSCCLSHSCCCCFWLVSASFAETSGQGCHSACNRINMNECRNLCEDNMWAQVGSLQQLGRRAWNCPCPAAAAIRDCHEEAAHPSLMSTSTATILASTRAYDMVVSTARST